jgi:hypothetical protein
MSIGAVTVDSNLNRMLEDLLREVRDTLNLKE